MDHSKLLVMDRMWKRLRTRRRTKLGISMVVVGRWRWRLITMEALMIVVRRKAAPEIVLHALLLNTIVLAVVLLGHILRRG